MHFVRYTRGANSLPNLLNGSVYSNSCDKGTVAWRLRDVNKFHDMAEELTPQLPVLLHAREEGDFVVGSKLTSAALAPSLQN